jgi:prolyl oligopeptidase
MRFLALVAAIATFTVSCGSDTRAVPPPATPTPVEPIATAEPPPRFPYPQTRRTDDFDPIYGMMVLDPYRWLEDGKSPEVQAWMHAEDALTHAELAKIPLRDSLLRRMKELSLQEQQWTPQVYGDRLFHQRREANRERAVVYWREIGKPDRVLLDPDTWSRDQSLFLGNWWPSWDGKRVVYQERQKNADAATLRVIDVASGKVSDVDVIEGGEWPEIAWAPKSDAFYYQWTTPDPALRPDRFTLTEGRFHKLGSDAKHDVVVRKPVPGQGGCPLQLDPAGRWLTSVVTRGWGKSDIYFEDLRDPRPAWHTLVEGRDALFDVQAYRQMLYVRSTDGTPRGELYAVDPRSPDRSAWKKIVPEQPDATLTGFQVIGHRLVLRYLQDVVTRLEIHELDGKLVHSMAAKIGDVSWLEGTPDADEAYYATHSYDRPRQIYKLSMKTGEETLWYTQPAPADFSKLVVEEVFFASKDGTRIPMFIFRPKDLTRDGTAPLLLSGYGAANVVSQPNYNPLLVPWVERGGVYASAIVRGGGEYGEDWHRAGSLRNKQNTFDDFVAAAEYLVREHYTSSDHLAIRGGSWGGLLVTAAMTQRPDLFRAVIALVPQTDMIRFPLSGLGKSPLAEFGNPADPDDFRVLFSYSPYHHVVAVRATRPRSSAPPKATSAWTRCTHASSRLLFRPQPPGARFFFGWTGTPATWAAAS